MSCKIDAKVRKLCRIDKVRLEVSGERHVEELKDLQFAKNVCEILSVRTFFFNFAMLVPVEPLYNA